MWRLLLLATLSAAKKSENKIVRNPTVRCGVDGVIFEMETMAPFTGQLYVKNEYKRDECRANFRNDSENQAGGVFRLHFNECGMRRQRMISPKGMAYSTTMVVQFHETFVTESDKAYQIRCFYREHNMGVNAEQMNISPLTTMLMEVSHPVPKCGYTIRHKSMDGPAATYVTVGDPVVHLFKCDTDDSMYRMLIRDCYVDDGKENRQQIIDENGCTVDEDIVETPEYTESQLVVFAEATVFKWPDESAVYFSCQLTLCTKEDPACLDISPPKCGTRRRKRRTGPGIFPVTRRSSPPAPDASPDPNAQLDLDLEVRRLVVLDLDPQHQSQIDSVVRKSHFFGQNSKPTTEPTATFPSTTERMTPTTMARKADMWMDYNMMPTEVTSPAEKEEPWTQATTTTTSAPVLRPRARNFADIPMVADLVIHHSDEPRTTPSTTTATALTPPAHTYEAYDVPTETGPWRPVLHTPQMVEYPLDPEWSPSYRELRRLAELGRLAEEERAEKERMDILARLQQNTPTTETPTTTTPGPERVAVGDSGVETKSSQVVVPDAVRHQVRLGTKSARQDAIYNQHDAFGERLADSPIFAGQCYGPELVIGLGVAIAVLGSLLLGASLRLLWPTLSRRSSIYSTGGSSAAARNFAPYYASSMISNPISACGD